MAQFKLENKVEVGKITLANFEQIKKDLTTSLEEYKTFKVTPKTYAEAKSKKAALNTFEKTLNLISSIEEETQKHKEATSFIKELNENTQLESKDIEVILTVNEKQWYQVQSFLKTIGAKMTKKKEGN